MMAMPKDEKIDKQNRTQNGNFTLVKDATCCQSLNGIHLDANMEMQNASRAKCRTTNPQMPQI